MSVGGECETDVTARTRCGWVRLGEWGELLLHGKRFPLNRKGAVNKRYVRPAVMRGSEAWCLKQNEMGISWTERYMVRALCRVQLKDRKSAKDVMLGLSETIDQLVIVNSSCCGMKMVIPLEGY